MDYINGAAEIDREFVLSTLLGCIPFRNTFNRDQFRQLHKDSRFLVLRKDALKAWVAESHQVGRYPWAKDVCDCDDQEALFRANRVTSRWRHEFHLSEAMGGIAYYSMTRGKRTEAGFEPGYHYAAWGIWLNDGVIEPTIYQPDTGEWQDVRSEVKEAVFIDG